MVKEVRLKDNGEFIVEYPIRQKTEIGKTIWCDDGIITYCEESDIKGAKLMLVDKILNEVHMQYTIASRKKLKYENIKSKIIVE